MPRSNVLAPATQHGRSMRILSPCTMLVLALAAFSGCMRQDGYPTRPVTIICPWAAGGGTDRVSRQIAMQLEQRLGVPVNVVNATGGKGVTGHNRGLSARPDGYTLTMMTFELNTMHWMGLTDLTYRDSIPLVSLNEDAAALLVANDAEWQSIEELAAAVKASPGQLTSSGTAAGGAWHLALAGWLIASGLNADDVVWIPSEGSNPSLQQLVSGGVDMVCCSLPEARSLIVAGEVRPLGVMSDKKAVGFDDVRTFAEQGSDWKLAGWRGIGVPRGTPQSICDQLRDALIEIVAAPVEPGSFAQFMRDQNFDSTWRQDEDFASFLEENDEKLGQLLSGDAMQSVMTDRFSPMLYPYLILVGLAGCGAAIGLRKRFASDAQAATIEAPTPEPGVSVSTKGPLVVCGAILFYLFGAETLGFLLCGAIVLFAMLLTLGARLRTSALVSVACVPLVYVIFSVLLRVPLPMGWWG